MATLTAGVESASVQDLLERSLPIARSLFQFLRNHSLLAERDPAIDAVDPFARQAEMMESWARSDLTADAIMGRLRDSTVLIIGAGGVGSALANLLTSCGIGRLYCVDFDRVAVTNLGRQDRYTLDDVGRHKAEVLAQRLNARQLNVVAPIVDRVSRASIGGILKDCDPVDVVSGIPLPNSEQAEQLVEYILDQGIPCLCVGEHDVGPFLRRSEDILTCRRQLATLYELHTVWERTRSARVLLEMHPSYAPDIAMTTAIAADEIVRYISGYAEVRGREGMFSLDPISRGVHFRRLVIDRPP
jgi:hypothetical protein